MRHIRKQACDNDYLIEANRNPPKYSWEDFRQHPLIDVLYKQLLHEQFGLCAYSEIKICLRKEKGEDDSFGCHIEHIAPRATYPHIAFCYQNLVLSALDRQDQFKLNQGNQFGGHFKANNYNEKDFISPTEEGCYDRYKYTSDGKVSASPDCTVQQRRMAQYTICILNLNCPSLISKRSEWLKDLEGAIERYQQKEKSLKKLAVFELGLRGNRLESFHSATRQCFSLYGREGEVVLQEQFPQLL